MLTFLPSSRAEAEVLAVALAGSVAVYDPETVPSVPGFSFRQEAHISPSVGGTTKATSFTLVSRSNPAERFAPAVANSLLPMLVVAVRGTASSVDRMINLNGKSRNMESFLVRYH